jgi:hypothetical protein
VSGHEAGVVVLAVGPGTHRATRCKSGQVVSMKPHSSSSSLSHPSLPTFKLEGLARACQVQRLISLSSPISGPESNYQCSHSRTTGLFTSHGLLAISDVD